MTRDTWPGTPDEALAYLLTGNGRFVAGTPEHPNQDAARRADSVSVQQPFAVLFGCSDSRVAAEIVFDRGLGDLFVVRTAGHLIGDEVLASVEYAVEQLRTPLVVVLGHDGCGAVAAALHAHEHGVTPAGHQRHIVERLSPEILAARARGVTDPEEVVRAHARSTGGQLLEQSALLREQVEAGACGVAVLGYRLAQGRAELLAAHGLTAPPPG